jgi:hypothetical protein
MSWPWSKSAEQNNSDEGSNSRTNEEVLALVLVKYPSLEKLNDSSIDELNIVLDEIKQNKLDKDILKTHMEVLAAPFFSNEASSKEEVLAYIKTMMKPYTISDYRANAVRKGGKRSRRRARKAKTSKRSKISKRGTRRS